MKNQNIYLLCLIGILTVISASLTGYIIFNNGQNTCSNSKNESNQNSNSNENNNNEEKIVWDLEKKGLELKNMIKELKTCDREQKCLFESKEINEQGEKVRIEIIDQSEDNFVIINDKKVTSLHKIIVTEPFDESDLEMIDYTISSVGYINGSLQVVYTPVEYDGYIADKLIKDKKLYNIIYEYNSYGRIILYKKEYITNGDKYIEYMKLVDY